MDAVVVEEVCALPPVDTAAVEAASAGNDAAAVEAASVGNEAAAVEATSVGDDASVVDGAASVVDAADPREQQPSEPSES